MRWCAVQSYYFFPSLHPIGSFDVFWIFFLGMHEDYLLMLNGRGQCFLCDYDLKSRNHAGQHIMGRKHKKNKELSEKINRAKIANVYGLSIQQQLEASNMNRRKNNSICDESDGSDSTISSASQSSNRMNVPDQIPIQYNCPLKADMTKWIYCELCQVCVNSAEQAEVHKMGRKHRQKNEALLGVSLVPSTTNPATIRPVGHGRRYPVSTEPSTSASPVLQQTDMPPTSHQGSTQISSLQTPTPKFLDNHTSTPLQHNSPDCNAFGLKDLSIPCYSSNPKVLHFERVDAVAYALAYMANLSTMFPQQDKLQV